jgi:hypothetical protein
MQGHKERWMETYVEPSAWARPRAEDRLIGEPAVPAGVLAVIGGHRCPDDLIAAAASRAEERRSRLSLVVTVPGLPSIAMGTLWHFGFDSRQVQAEATREAIGRQSEAAAGISDGLPLDHRLAPGSLRRELARLAAEGSVSHVFIDRALCAHRPSIRRLLRGWAKNGASVEFAGS